jgi:hypothetical protein
LVARASRGLGFESEGGRRSDWVGWTEPTGLVQPNQLGRLTGGPEGYFGHFQNTHLNENFQEFYKIKYSSKKISKNMKINQHKILYLNKISKRIFEDKEE